jgi:hypothetical protein
VVGTRRVPGTRPRNPVHISSRVEAVLLRRRTSCIEGIQRSRQLRWIADPTCGVSRAHGEASQGRGRTLWGGPAMTPLVRRLAANLAVALVPMAAVMVATPAVSSAQCDPNFSRNVWTNECKPPPPPPPWYSPPPPYAPKYAPQWIPPPPGPAPGAPPLHPVWDQGRGRWVWVGI